jgi:hypothetical protein
MVLKSSTDPDKPPVNTKDEQTSRDEQARSQTVKDEPAAKKPVRGELRVAAESGDPDVHRLLAHRNIYEQHLAEVDSDVTEDVRDRAEEKIAAIDDQLADLGYTAK